MEQPEHAGQAEQGERVRAAMAATPRSGFLPRPQRLFASLDAPLPIGAGQTNSQPSTVRRMLELLDVREGDRVLDVGAGSGWTTAILGRLVGRSGSVLGVELVPELAEFGSANVERAGMPWARVERAHPGVLGAPEGGPYDRILVSAEPRELPRALVDQLAPGGVLVVPVAGRMLRVVRVDDGITVSESGHYRFVPLVSG